MSPLQDLRKDHGLNVTGDGPTQALSGQNSVGGRDKLRSIKLARECIRFHILASVEVFS